MLIVGKHIFLHLASRHGKCIFFDFCLLQDIREARDRVELDGPDTLSEEIR